MYLMISPEEKQKLIEYLAEAVYRSLSDISEGQNTSSYYAGVKSGMLDALVALGVGDNLRKEIEKKGIEEGVRLYKEG